MSKKSKTKQDGLLRESKRMKVARDTAFQELVSLPFNRLQELAQKNIIKEDFKQ